MTYATTVKVCCRKHRLPIPAAEYRFAPPRRWRFDWAWPEARLALEIDGGLWSRGRHARASGIVKEHEKFNTAAAKGWRVFRTTPQGLAHEALWTLIAEAML